MAKASSSACALTMHMCPYQILGLAPGASAEAIRSAWRHRSLDCHPDKRPGDPAAHVKFRALTNAKDCLLDPAWHLQRAATAFGHAYINKGRQCSRGTWGDVHGPYARQAGAHHGSPAHAVAAARQAAAAANKKFLEESATRTRKQPKSVVAWERLPNAETNGCLSGSGTSRGGPPKRRNLGGRAVPAMRRNHCRMNHPE